MTIQSQAGAPYPNLKVYAFDGTRYTGFNGTTDANGEVLFTLPEGSYRFRADYNPQGSEAGSVQFWSSPDNACTLPGCESAAVLLPSAPGEPTVTTCATKVVSTTPTIPSTS